VIERGRIYWIDLGEAAGSRLAKRRPVLAIQADSFNKSRLATALVAVITSNTKLAVMPGNVFVPASVSGLPRDSVVNVTALATVDKVDLDGPVGRLPSLLLQRVEAGLRQVLEL